MQVLYVVLAFFAFFHLIIFVHEFGHYFVGRSLHMAIPRFTVGAGPKLLRFIVGETTFEWRLFPIWGFVQPLGVAGPNDANILALQKEEGSLEELVQRLERRGGMDTHAAYLAQQLDGIRTLLDPKRHYYSMTGWQQIMFLIAGSVMNVVLGVVLAALSIGMEARNPTLFVVEKHATQTSTSHPDTARKGDRFYLIQRLVGKVHVTDIPTLESVLICLRLRTKGQPEQVPYNATAKEALSEAGLFTLKQYGACNWAELSHCFRVIQSAAEMPFAPDNKSRWLVERTAQEMFQFGFFRTLFWQVALSNLMIAIFNLLPVPPLDGGKIVFSFFKAVGRPLPDVISLRISLVGFAIVAVYYLFQLILMFRDLLTPQW